MTTGFLFDTMNPEPARHRWVPDTSKAAHTALVNAGKVTGRKAEVLAWLLQVVGPCTAAELSERVHGDHALEHVLHIRRGLSDLRKAGLVCKGEDRQCAVTGTKANVWKVGTR
jgi:hypothetical protein